MANRKIIDVEALKCAWRKRISDLAELTDGNVRIDPLEGRQSSAQLALIHAVELRQTHNARMANALRVFVAAHPLNFDNGSGAVDSATVDERADPNWWRFHIHYWRYGAPRMRRYFNTPILLIDLIGQLEENPTESVAVHRVHDQALRYETLCWQERVSWSFMRQFPKRDEREFVLAVGAVLREERAQSAFVGEA